MAIGAIRNGKLTRDRAYALPGMPVTTASANELAQVYGIENTDIKVGYLRDARECTVCLEVNKIFRPHMTVIGRTGSGKSYFVKSPVLPLKIHIPHLYIYQASLADPDEGQSDSSFLLM